MTFRPTFRFELRQQSAPLVQGALFEHSTLNIEHSTCNHSEGGWQRDLFGDCTYCCTACGVDLPEPIRTG